MIYNDVCVIIGAGPSLNNTNLDLIPSTAKVFACNHYYKIMDQFQRKPDAIVITDSYRLVEVGENYKNFKGEMFIGNQKYINPPYQKIKKIVGRDFVAIPQLSKRNLNKIPFVRNMPIPDFLHDLIFKKRSWNSFDFRTTGVNFGSSVIFAATQIAIAQGYKKIIYVGVDANYEDKMYSFDLEDKTFFVNDFFIKNPRFNIEPYLVSMQIFFESFGVNFIDCTVSGSLKYISKSSLEKEFSH